MQSESKRSTNAVGCVELLWQDSFFKVGRTLKDVSARITEKWESNFLPPEISNALGNARFLIRSGKRGFFLYKQRISAVSKKVDRIEDELFSDDLVNKLSKDFKIELDDLHHNFGYSGNCTAFVLRKILEKEIYLTFAKNRILTKLEDNNGKGNLIGLGAMVDTAAREKIGGIPILQPQTAGNIKSIKFLGDVSAHNPLTNVDMETILPQMPFIITAYKELAERL